MASKKILSNLDGGLWCDYGHPADGYTASAYLLREVGGDGYVLSFHKGEMPAFAWQTFSTAEELETAMRAVQPDLRKWKTRIGA